jgi:translation initiation factor eIF-2B subunit delta
MNSPANTPSSSRVLALNGEVPASQQPNPQPTISKAEQSRQRRAIQEQQRAAKAAAKNAPNVPGPSRPRSGSKLPPPPSTPKKSGAGTSKTQRDSKDAGSLAGDEFTGKSHGIRIFSHFGLPKPVSHVGKGDIHPAIVRLGLQFSEFKISGANARCIATLTAFKTVCLCRSDIWYVAHKFAGHTRLRDTTE